ncbi:MAG: DinB family protein [Candidatus Tectomicrobia bacterium]|nr:DinB family protein [Candidatus Tectomicrobia bacterium]
MRWQELLVDGYGRIYQILRKALTGLSPEDLRWQPRPDGNSMGWLAWHLTRVQDHHIAALLDAPQLYLSDGWHAKFDRPADAQDIGFGHGSDEVARFQAADAETLLAYHRAVYERSKGYLAALSDAGLGRELNEPQYQPLPTVGVRLISILSDNLQHAGQIAYLRGLRQGKGWLGA